MGFWIFMLLMNVIIPFTMIGFGKYFCKSGPKDINMAFGYRTGMSMKNKETWVFAHQYIGKLWYRIGWMLLGISVIAMLILYGREKAAVDLYGGYICIVQLVVLILPIIPTEIALRKSFDKNGRYRK